MILTLLGQRDGATTARSGVAAFARECRRAIAEYALTPRAEATPYARCFAIYCRHLCRDSFELGEREALAIALRRDIRAARKMRHGRPDDKPYRQLLAFTLSALAILDALPDDPLADLVEEQVAANVAAELERVGALSGRPGSGNQAMFLAIFLLHARRHLAIDTGRGVAEWVELHLAHMNRFGFWGAGAGMTHLHFQNGYHQYEILEYLQVPNPRAADAVAAVAALADPLGHYAPYPGGGGCFDYDATFVMTPGGRIKDETARRTLHRTAATIASEQQQDGGFAESLQVRPRSISALGRTVGHIARGRASGSLLTERLRYGLTLQRPRHDRIHTHWSSYSRRWSESNLWDSWFRLLTLARIQTAIDPSKATDWGFVDYPGIGHHARLREGRD